MEDIPLVQPLFIPFSRRKNDQQTTSYSMNGPFQRIHADLADINYLKPNATEPKYILVIVDLFSSKVYLYPLKNKGKLINGMQYFYSEIYEASQVMGLFNRDKRGIECPPPYLSSTRGRTWKSYENNQTNCVNGTGTFRSESVAHGRTDVRCEHRQTFTQLSHRKVDSLLLRMASINVGTLRGRAGEVVEMLERRSVDVCCVQEVRWRGASVRFVEGRRARYKLFWIGNSTGYGGVGIFIAEKWVDKVIDVKRVNDRIIVVKFLIGKRIVTAVSVYTPVWT